MQKLKNYLVRLYLWFNRLRLNYFSAAYKKNKAIITQLQNSGVKARTSGAPDFLQKQLYLFSTFRVNSPLRQEILKTTINRSLAGLANSQLDYWVLDASAEEYVQGNREVFQALPGLSLGYYPKKVRFQDAHASVHRDATQPYFCLIYDDQPIVGLNPEFLSAACNFLEDFKGLVDLMLIESPQKYTVDQNAKKIIFEPDSLEFKTRGEKPIAILKYGQYEFALLHNYHYGFFFNTIIADRKVYAEKLKWYMEHVQSSNAQDIELAGMRRQGPVYDFIAVPLQAAMFNIDCAHSELSIREVADDTRKLYEAMSAGFVVEAKS